MGSASDYQLPADWSYHSTWQAGVAGWSAWPRAGCDNNIATTPHDLMYLWFMEVLRSHDILVVSM